MNWRATRDYRLWRVAVIRRDKVCQFCGSNKKRHAHHLNHANFFKDERFDVSNGICLCATCHSVYHNKFHGNTRKKCTAKDYARFIVLSKYTKEVLSCIHLEQEV